MKYYKISGKVVVDFEGELEFEDGDKNIEQLAKNLLNGTSMSNWWSRLSVSTYEQPLELVECELVCQTCDECGIKLTAEQWPEGTSCPVCNPYSGE